jgi:hypothetical protein
VTYIPNPSHPAVAPENTTFVITYTDAHGDEHEMKIIGDEIVLVVLKALLERGISQITLTSE